MMGPWRTLAPACVAAALGGCALADATAGAAVSVTGAVLTTGVQLTGKALGAGIDALAAPPAEADGSGIVVRERIRRAPAPAAGEFGDASGSAPAQQDPGP